MKYSLFVVVFFFSINIKLKIIKHDYCFNVSYYLQVLGLYGLVFMVALPTTVGMWWYKSIRYSGDKV